MSKQYDPLGSISSDLNEIDSTLARIEGKLEAAREEVKKMKVSAASVSEVFDRLDRVLDHIPRSSRWWLERRVEGLEVAPPDYKGSTITYMGVTYVFTPNNRLIEQI